MLRQLAGGNWPAAVFAISDVEISIVKTIAALTQLSTAINAEEGWPMVSVVVEKLTDESSYSQIARAQLENE